MIDCHHGVRSWAAAEMLEAAGYCEAYSLAEGIDDWSLAVDSNVTRYA